LISAAMATTTPSSNAGICIPPTTMRTFSVPGSPAASGWVSAVTSAGSAAPGLFATPGLGQ
jgi:hypothetical protein